MFPILRRQAARYRVVWEHPLGTDAGNACPHLLSHPGHHCRFGEQFLCSLLPTSSTCSLSPVCLCVSVSVSLLVCGLPLVVRAHLAFVWGRLGVLGSWHL